MHSFGVAFFFFVFLHSIIITQITRCVTCAHLLPQIQAIDARDELVKLTYASMFDWLVEQINKSLEVRKQCTGRSISILDIYGFESFKVYGLCSSIIDVFSAVYSHLY